MKTEVVNIHRTHCEVYIGRAGKGQSGYFGNPFQLGSEEVRGATIARYREYFLERIDTDPEFKRRVLSLRGKRLGCFCHPLPCHGDVIVEWLEGQP